MCKMTNKVYEYSLNCIFMQKPAAAPICGRSEFLSIFRNKNPDSARRLFKPKSANILPLRKFDRIAAATRNHHSFGIFPQNSFNGHRSQSTAAAQARAIIKRAFTSSILIMLAPYFIFLFLDFFNQLLKLFHERIILNTI